jgi:primosomal replication protein N
MGTLKSSITMADLVGTWDQGAGSVQSYIDSYTGNYAGTNTSFYGEQYSIRSDGSFDYKFVGRSSNKTTRESDSGTVILSGGFITLKFKTRATQKYQFIALMTQPNGAAILSLVGVHDNFQGYDAAGMSLECGHGSGYIHCVGGEEWARLGAAKPAVVVNKPPDPVVSNADFLDFDPFPDKPYIQAQQPLTGRLRKTITAADLAGTWEIGGASVQQYVASSSNTYSSASLFGKKYFIRSDGTYDSKFQGRASNTTIRETDSGSVILDGGFITMKSKQNPAMRYQFVAYMVQPNGAAVLSLIYLGESPPLDGAHGYITCLNGEEWVRIP